MKFIIEVTNLPRGAVKRLGREAFTVFERCNTWEEAEKAETRAWNTRKYRAVQIKEVEGDDSLFMVKKLWEKFADTPVNDEGEIEEPFLNFTIGTHRYEVWHWFEKHFDCSIAEDLMQ